MANKTINDLTATTTAATGDFVPIWRASNGDTRKITRANFIGATLTGAGTIATGGFTLTIAATSTINGSLVGNMTGGGTVATGGFTLTVPATGTAALLATAQTFTALKTFSAGISLGNETLSTYDQGTFTPVVADATSAGNTATVATAIGNYTKIGNLVKVDVTCLGISTVGLTATNVLYIRGLPFASLGTASYQAQGAANVANIAFTGILTATIGNNSSAVFINKATTGAAADFVAPEDMTSGTASVIFSITYLAAS